MPPLLQISPTAVYDVGAIAISLGVSLDAIERAKRSGQLHYTRAGRRVLILGSHILDWLEGDRRTPFADGKAVPCV